jgi:3-hydroxyacyl-CoA dehydrogenase
MQMKNIKKAAVLGAGVMGATIAAHLANAGLDVLLLDMVPRELNDAEKAKGLTMESPAVRNRLATQGIQGAVKGRGLYHKSYVGLMTAGNFDDDIAKLQDCDWVVEVVVENMAIKKSLLIEKIIPNINESTILTTNTSGLSINAMAEILPEAMRKNFLVTHFFNPPRYMRLLELVPSKYTDPEVFAAFSEFCGKRLGKGIVHCKDTPNFIGNRIGVYAICNAVNHLVEMGLTVEEADALSGPATARPGSAIFRTLDLVGLDTFAMVSENTHALVEGDEDRENFKLPAFVAEMVANGQIGNKSRQGFYKKEKDGSRFYFDYTAGEYKPVAKPKFDSMTAAKNGATAADKLKLALQCDDQAAEFAWRNLRDSILYTVKRVPEISDDIVNIDNAMKWGFSWAIGPFEMLDAIGVDAFIKRVEADGIAVPEALRGVACFYKTEGASKLAWDLVAKEYRKVAVKPGTIDLAALKNTGKLLESNEEASLIDLGDDVFCLEFHSKMNAIGFDSIEMIDIAVKRAEESAVALVVANQGKAFSAGANLTVFADAIKKGDLETVDKMIANFQGALMRMKYSSVPVVAAPFGLALGGGCEVVLHADAVVAHAELNMGLVEIGVGLLPGGGGTKEMGLRAIEAVSACRGDILPFITKNFQNILLGKVSTSAVDNFDNNLLKAGDTITMDIDALIANAKQQALSMAKTYRPSQPKTGLKAPGRSVAAALKSQVWNMMAGGFATEYELEIASEVVDVMTGGDVPGGTLITEQYLLDLERKSFLKLCGNEKTIERIEHMLKVGKVLRN